MLCLRCSVAGLCFLASSAAAQGLSIHEAVQRALHSPIASGEDSRVDAARGAVRQAGLGPNPKLYLQSEDLRPWSDSFDFSTQTENYGYLGQTIEVDGKRGKRVQVASARLRQASAERALRLRQLSASVVSAYWNAVSLGRIAELLADDLKTVDEMVEYHQKRVEAGAMRGVDLLRMRIERDRLALALDVAKRDATEARLELFKQMGTVATEEPLTDTMDVIATPPVVDLQVAFRQRPEIEAAEAAVAAAEADLKLQKANGVPDPDLFGGYKRNNGDNTAYAALQIPLPVRNRNQGEVERARATVTAAQTALQAARARIAIEVRQAQASYDAQEKSVRQTLPALRQHAQQNLDIITEAYRIGGVDLLRFLDAERTRFDVEVSAVRTMAQLQQSAAQLQLAYGVQP